MFKLDKVLYTAKTHTEGGREGGTVKSSDGQLDIVTAPPGGPKAGVNPEQLFAAGWSTCFLSALKIGARKLKVELPATGVAIDTEIDLGMLETNYQLSARLNVSLPGISREDAENLIAFAEKTCPYSRAIRGNIDAVISLRESSLAAA